MRIHSNESMKAIKRMLRMERKGRPGWTIHSISILRLVLTLSGLQQTLFGDVVVGVMSIVVMLLISMPDIFTGNLISDFPIEFKFTFLVMAFFQYVLGEARDFYELVPYYDKFIHFLMPFFIGFLLFFLLYTSYAAAKLGPATGWTVLVMVLLTMGICAGWELAEYASDTWLYGHISFWKHFQGNGYEDPLRDTMNDLFMDLTGALAGSMVGFWVDHRFRWQKSHWYERLTLDVERMLGPLFSGLKTSSRETYATFR